MMTRSYKAITARPIVVFAVLLAAGLLFQMSGGLLQAQETAESVTFYENSGDSVVTLTAWDPELVAPIHWDILDIDVAADLPGGEVRVVTVTGGTIAINEADEIDAGDIADNALFTVEDGALSFNKPPNFEAPGDAGADNIYKVVVVASDGGSATWVQYFKLTIEVLDSPEDGEVKWTVDPDDAGSEGDEQDLLEFQAGAVVTATLTDPDNITSGVTDGAITTGITWRWYRSSSKSGPWHNIFVEDVSHHDTTDAGTDAYTASDDGDSYDVGMYLRAEAKYVDRRGGNETAEFISPHPVKAAKQADNSNPEFAPLEHQRRVQEALKVGSDVGAPVKATDVDDDVLNYTLAAQYSVDADGTRTVIATDLPFKINQATGQIMTNAKLNFDHVYDAGTGDASATVPPRAYTVVVKATDSAGGETVDPPDLDNLPDDSSAVVTITLLNVNEPPEFVNPETDRDDVVDDNVEGRAADKFEEGVDPDPNTAGNQRAWNGVVSDYTVYDPEGVVIKGDKWSLEGADAALFTLTLNEDNVKRLSFKGQADFETPMDANGDNIYEVTVVASDVEQMAKRSVSVKITDSDEAGTIRLSSENPEAGTPVTATLEDSDGQVINVSWTWQESDNAAFTEPATISSRDVTVSADGMMSSYTPTSGDINNYLRVTAEYTDRTEDENNDPEPVANDLVDGETIEETSGHDNIRFNNTATSRTVQVVSALTNNPPEFVEGGSTTRYVEENSDAERPGRAVVENIGAPLEIDDTNGEGPGLHTWSLGGPDAASFDIDAADGQLRTRDALDRETEDTYTVIVTVEDSSNEPNDSDSITVTIEVKDLDEKPVIQVGSLTMSGPASVSHVENDKDVVATYTLTGMNAANATWSLQGDDADDFDIMGGTLTFMTAPDYEDPSDADMNNMYMVTVMADDGSSVATRAVAVRVENKEEKGMVELSSLTPVVDVELTATLTDLDGSITGETWQWSRSSTMNGVFTQIPSANMASYKPKAADDSYYLMVEVAYTDGHGTGKDTETATTGMVTSIPDQPGTLRLSSENPVLGIKLTATLSDPDGSVTGEAWQWSKSMDMEGTFEDIEDATAMSYTPVEADGGYYLMVKVTYTDGHGPGKMAMETTDAKVITNTAPVFRDGVSTTRSVMEGSAAGASVGSPVAATDAEDDALTYTLGGDDAASFALGEPAGQITVREGTMLDDDVTDSYSVTVTVSDGEYSDSIDVTINVTDMQYGCSGPSAADCEALLEAMPKLEGADSTRSLNWAVGTPIAEWDGVRKLSESGRVEWLYLHGVSANEETGRAEVKLNGTIAVELADLDGLTRLYLHRNNLTGAIPGELSGLNNLVWLRLYDNMLDGPIPDLSGMDSLERLYLHENMLSGEIPMSLGSLSSLTHMLLQRNDLTGEIPAMLGDMDTLVWLGLYDNMLSGGIPMELGSLSSLERLYLHGNMLTGEVPSELGNLSALTNLWLNDNQLDGTIPTELDQLTDLNRWRLRNNDFTGCVPAGMAAVENSDMASLDLPACQ